MLNYCSHSQKFALEPEQLGEHVRKNHYDFQELKRRSKSLVKNYATYAAWYVANSNNWKSFVGLEPLRKEPFEIEPYESFLARKRAGIPKPIKGDQVFANNIMFLIDGLGYLELSDAIKDGDFGRIARARDVRSLITAMRASTNALSVRLA